MSLYNMVMGNHPLAGELLGILGYDQETVHQIPRFRDVYLYPGEIRLLTRTGGGNRPDYEDANTLLTMRPNFLRDWDDQYDSTFAWWAYSFPEDWTEQLNMLVEKIQQDRPDLMPEHLGVRFEEAIARIGGKDADTDTKSG